MIYLNEIEFLICRVIKREQLMLNLTMWLLACMFLPPRDHKWRKSGRRASLPPRPTLTVVDIDIDGKSVGKNSAAPCNTKTSSTSLTSNNRYR